MATTTLKKKEIEYPTSDGKPMAESDTHRISMFESIDRLALFFEGQKVYVSGNLLIYYVEGNPHKCVAPDTFVVKKCKPGKRDIFKIWAERRKPDFVLENTSKSTRKEDTVTKKEIYAQIGVKEYFLYDPFGDWLKPPLQGFKLVRGAYERIMPDADGSVLSKELGIRFLVDENGNLVMFNAATGERLLTHDEAQNQRAESEKQRAESEKQRAESEKQRAESEKQRAAEADRRAESENQRAEAEKRRAEEATQRADQEKQRADQAMREMQALQEELRRLRESTRKPHGKTGN